MRHQSFPRSYDIEKSESALQNIKDTFERKGNKMSCFCNLFNDPTVWLIIIALILLFMNCNNDDCDCGCHCGTNRNNFGNYNNNGCGCGCNG